MNIQLKYVDKGHTYIIDFDLESTCKVPEFETYYKLRDKNPKIQKEKWYKKFGKDYCQHFELAYAILKEEENYE